MKKVYLNYANINFYKHQRFALRAAKLIGNFDTVIGLSPKDIDEEFHKRFREILEQKKGGGYWLWKPYIIKKTLSQLSYGDYLFYSDAGAFFLKKVDSLIIELDKQNQDIMGFELPLIEDQWTKRELFINMKCEGNKYSSSNQILASFILIKKTISSEQFFNKFLKYACVEKNITDSHSCSVKQLDCFIEHRHDQSIFSLLYKKFNLKPFKDPTQLGKYPKGYSDNIKEDVLISNLKSLKKVRKFRVNNHYEKYSLILYHNKKGNPLKSFIKYLIKEFLFKIKIYKGIVR